MGIKLLLTYIFDKEANLHLMVYGTTMVTTKLQLLGNVLTIINF